MFVHIIHADDHVLVRLEEDGAIVSEERRKELERSRLSPILYLHLFLAELEVDRCVGVQAYHQVDEVVGQAVAARSTLKSAALGTESNALTKSTNET